MNNLPAAWQSHSLDRYLRGGHGLPCRSLQSMGYRVTGSDQNVYPPMSHYLQGVGIPILVGLREEHLSPRPDLVSSVTRYRETIPKPRPRSSQSIPYISFPQASGSIPHSVADGLGGRWYPWENHDFRAGCMGACTGGLGAGLFYRWCPAQLQQRMESWKRGPCGFRRRRV